jgi:predicted enzyme related to lactoylglutathione lyase
VPEVNPVTERAEELGASVLLGPREGPAGWRSVVRAPDGGEIAFWQPKSVVPLEEAYAEPSAKR